MKGYFDNIGKNIDLASIETENQINTMKRLMNIIHTGIPDLDKSTAGIKLRIKRRRKAKLKETTTATLSLPGVADKILYSRRQSAISKKPSSMELPPAPVREEIKINI